MNRVALFLMDGEIFDFVVLSDGLAGFEELWVLGFGAGGGGLWLFLLELGVNVVGKVWNVVCASHRFGFLGWPHQIRIDGNLVRISGLLFSSENFINLLELLLLLLDLQEDSAEGISVVFLLGSGGPF